MRLSARSLIEARLPRAFWALSPRTFPNPQLVQVCQRYVAAFVEGTFPSLGLFLHGLPQSGKTFLQVLILRSLLARGYAVMYFTLFELGQLYLGRFAEVPGLTLNHLHKLDLVAIDDVVEDPTKQERNALRQVTQRVQRQAHLLLGSTCTLGQLTVAFDGSTVSRLRANLVDLACVYDHSFEQEAALEKARAQLYA